MIFFIYTHTDTYHWVVGSILMVDQFNCFSFQPVLHDLCNKGLICIILSVG